MPTSPAGITSLDALEANPIVHSQPSFPTTAEPANPAPAARTSANASTTTSPVALVADPLVHLQAAPKQHLAWEKGLMFMEFKKGSKKLHGPAAWCPQIGSAGEGFFESVNEIELELQANLQDKLAEQGNPDGGHSSFAMHSTSHAASSSAKPSTTTGSRGPGGRSRGISTRTKGVASRTVSTTSSQYDSGSKRKRTAADTSDQAPQKKVKLAEGLLIDSTSPAVVQLADYAAESLYSTFGRSRVLGLLVKDATINIWHFDHEAPLQMTGFDFLKDQHYLFLFLLALQRFDNKDWGFLPGFDKLIGKDNIELDLTHVWVDDQQAEDRKFTGKKKDLKKPPFGLGGRATGVMYGSVKGKEVVVKLAWPEKNRNREKEVVDTARKRFNDMNLPDYNPGDYLPDILAAREYPEFESGPLRDAVLQDGSKYDDIKLGSRIPYFIVMPKYQPITDLTHKWGEFMSAFYALFYCHAMLWSIGIRHGDISETNLMWDPEKKKPKLCDFDLSHFCEAPQIGVPEKGPDGPMGLSNTGTWIFMADELLTVRAMQGLVKRVYRHEVEAFVAVLVWIMCRYNQGKLRPERPLERWNQTTFPTVVAERTATFGAMIADPETDPLAYAKPSGVPDKLWHQVQTTVQSMVQYRLQAVSLKSSLPIPKHSNKSSQAETSEDSDDSDSDSRKPRRPPIEAPEEYDDLTSLRKKVLDWDVFGRSRAKVFVKLMKERILNPDKQQEMKA